MNRGRQTKKRYFFLFKSRLLQMKLCFMLLDLRTLEQLTAQIVLSLTSTTRKKVMNIERQVSDYLRIRMFLLNLPLNLKEHAAIERRQHEEKQRLARIFDEKFRTIGV